MNIKSLMYKRVLEIKRGDKVPFNSKWLGEKIYTEEDESCGTDPMGGAMGWIHTTYDIYEVIEEEIGDIT